MMLFDRYVAAATLGLVASTFRLWFGMHAGGSLPLRIPMMDISVPTMVVPLLASACVASLVIIILFRPIARIVWAITAGCLAALFMLDNLTLQPWAYQTLLYALLFAICGIGDNRLLRVVAISIYLYSGLGKLDYQFSHTVGQTFLSTLTFGLSDGLPISIRAPAALLLPIGEVMVAILLMFPTTRRGGAVAAIAMHTTLIAMVGPWALHHSWGVLVWNMVLIGQAYLLFWRSTDPPLSSRRLTIPALVITMIVILGPLLERRGYWDHWLAWSLYAPHTSRASMQVSSSSLHKLGPLRQYADDDRNGDRWHEIDLSRWILETRSVPMYPQSRYQLRLIQTIIRDHDLQRGVRVTLGGVSDRWTGMRQESKRLGRDEILDFSKKI